MSTELLMAYSVLDDWYQNGLLKKIEGEPAAAASEVASIQDPDDTFVPIRANEADPKVFSYAYGQDPAVLVAKAVSAAGEQPSSCKYTLAAPKAGIGTAWKVLARDIVLKSGGEEVATNPYGVAQVGNWLFLIDFDSPKIYQLGVNELNGLPDKEEHELAYTPFDPNDEGAGLPALAKGQAIIAAQDAAGTLFLFALYTVADLTIYPTWFNMSYLVKIAIDPDYGILSYESVITDLAKNAQELIYISNFNNNTPGLLIPAIGGPQKDDGTTNEIDSKLELVMLPAGSMTKSTLLTGDAVVSPATPTTWDIKAFAAAPDTAGSSPIFILTGTMDTDDNQNWRLYGGTLAGLRNLNNTPLSQATALWESDSGEGAPGYYWDIYYENGTGSGPAGDRLWFLRGSPIVVGAVAGFPNNPKTFASGYDQGQIGGVNVDSATLVSETMKQAAKGLSLKRGLRGIAALTPPEEAEEEK
jgi:hypothetical protein